MLFSTRGKLPLSLLTVELLWPLFVETCDVKGSWARSSTLGPVFVSRLAVELKPQHPRHYGLYVTIGLRLVSSLLTLTGLPFDTLCPGEYPEELPRTQFLYSVNSAFRVGRTHPGQHSPSWCHHVPRCPVSSSPLTPSSSVHIPAASHSRVRV